MRHTLYMTCQHPGKVLLKQYMQPKQLSQNKLAKALAVPPRRINEIVLGKRAITADTAVRLGVYFGNSASFWMHIQAEYDIALAKDKLGSRLYMIKALHKDPVESIQSDSVDTDPITTIKNKNIKRHLMR